MSTNPNKTETPAGTQRRSRKVGTVVSNKMEKTVVVEVVRVAWTLIDPQAPPDAFLATESQAKSEDAIVVVRPKTELPDMAPYRMPAVR